MGSNPTFPTKDASTKPKIARLLMPFTTVASAEVCEAFGRPGRRSLRLSEIPKAELEKRLCSGGIFVNYRNDRLRIYCE